MNIKKYRLQGGMTQNDLAFATGLSVRQIQELESGRVNPRHVKADTLLRISNVLGISIKNLIGAHHINGKIMYHEDFVWLTPDNIE